MTVRADSFSIFAFTTFIIIAIFAQVILLSSRDNSNFKKNLFVRTVMLPDLAISSETHYVRHRSISDLFSMFSNSPTLTEFFPSTFVYNYSQIQRKIPSRIELDK
jgi:hypothetical protein